MAAHLNTEMATNHTVVFKDANTEILSTGENMDAFEPILKDDVHRFCLFPIQDEAAYKMYQNAVSAIWVPGEIDLSKDLVDWHSLNDAERHFLSYVLAFFAGSDGIVNQNIGEKFLNEVQMPEHKAFYAFQLGVESIHSDMYSILLNTYITDSDERDHLFHAVETIPCIKQKADWALRWSGSNRTFAERLVAFAAVEGIFFSGSFASIFWMKRRGLMTGLCQSNEFIARDEGSHTDFACLLFSRLIYKPQEKIVLDIITEAVTLEQSFICDALPVSLIGMSNTQMSKYIEFVADRLLNNLGYPNHYNTPNPLSFMENISLEGKANFFEIRASEYKKIGGGVAIKEEISADGDF